MYFVHKKCIICIEGTKFCSNITYTYNEFTKLLLFFLFAIVFSITIHGHGLYEKYTQCKIRNISFVKIPNINKSSFQTSLNRMRELQSRYKNLLHLTQHLCVLIPSYIYDQFIDIVYNPQPYKSVPISGVQWRCSCLYVHCRTCSQSQCKRASNWPVYGLLQTLCAALALFTLHFIT